MKKRHARIIRDAIADARMSLIGDCQPSRLLNMPANPNLRDRAFIREFNKISKNNLHRFVHAYIEAMRTGQRRSEVRIRTVNVNDGHRESFGR